MEGESKLESVTHPGASWNAELGGVSGSVAVVAQSVPKAQVPDDSQLAAPGVKDVTQPAGKAGGVTPSKFWAKWMPRQLGVGLGVAVAVAVAVGVGEGVPVGVGVGIGVGVGVGVGFGGGVGVGAGVPAVPYRTSSETLSEPFETPLR